MTTFESSHYLLCALGDGALFYFGLNIETGESAPCAGGGLPPLRLAVLRGDLPSPASPVPLLLLRL